jgi:hypothetical protein
MDLQQTTDTLHSIHTIINTYPRIISQTAPNSAELTNMANGLKLALQNTIALQESSIFADPSFCSKVTGKLISIAAMFMDNVSRNRDTVAETDPSLFSYEGTIDKAFRFPHDGCPWDRPRL